MHSRCPRINLFQCQSIGVSVIRCMHGVIIFRSFFRRALSSHRQNLRFPIRKFLCGFVACYNCGVIIYFIRSIFNVKIFLVFFCYFLHHLIMPTHKIPAYSNLSLPLRLTYPKIIAKQTKHPFLNKKIYLSRHHLVREF